MEDREAKKRFLLALLPNLEAIKANVESQIFAVKKELDEINAGEIDKDRLEDPDVLGIDTLGRVIKRRKLSPEVVEKKRALMKSIRDQRLADLEELKKLREEKEKLKALPATVGAGKRK